MKEFCNGNYNTSDATNLLMSLKHLPFNPINQALGIRVKTRSNKEQHIQDCLECVNAKYSACCP